MLIVASLACLYGAGDTPRRVRCTDLNEDIEATVRCLAALGAGIDRCDEDFIVTPITRLPAEATLDCGESGSTMRFLLPVCCALGGVDRAPTGFTVSMIGHGRLPERPLSPLYEELVAHGAEISLPGTNPLVVTGKLTPGTYIIDGGVSSQFISGLLFALPLLGGNSQLNVTGRIESIPYIGMTLDAIAAATNAVSGTLPLFDIEGKQHSFSAQTVSASVNVGGDWSGAAFFLAAGALCPNGQSVAVSGLNINTRQGDHTIVDILRHMGTRIEAENDRVTAYSSHLRGCTIDAGQVPDLVPILAVAAALADGETHITGAARLRIKESDRLATVTAMLTALGGLVTELPDGLIIRGVPRLRGGVISAAGDHRIAMSAAIAATRCDGPVTVMGAEAVKKSYPAFWDDLASIDHANY